MIRNQLEPEQCYTWVVATWSGITKERLQACRQVKTPLTILLRVLAAAPHSQFHQINWSHVSYMCHGSYEWKLGVLTHGRQARREKLVKVNLPVCTGLERMLKWRIHFWRTISWKPVDYRPPIYSRLYPSYGGHRFHSVSRPTSLKDAHQSICMQCTDVCVCKLLGGKILLKLFIMIKAWYIF